MKLVRIYDENSVFFRWKIQNETLVCQLTLAQLIVTSASLAQHIYSIARFDSVFLCSFNSTASRLRGHEYASFLAYDIIIYDFGLFHRLISVQECIANYLDGGYMRCMWCITQELVLLTVLVLPFIRDPPPYLLWPMLLLQNSYCLGLLILSIASADKLIVSLLGQAPSELTYLIALFLIGTCTNYFLDYILWHLYWHVDKEHRTRAAQRPEWI